MTVVTSVIVLVVWERSGKETKRNRMKWERKKEREINETIAHPFNLLPILFPLNASAFLSLPHVRNKWGNLRSHKLHKLHMQRQVKIPLIDGNAERRKKGRQDVQ